ncbi:ABC transporter substrate-binding protein [Paenibacillus wynnii]|uniref:ABC transporter substrate-binding protein n=1 Tax=Paenibacillus wynnii TaxID=268407 RepID=A0A098M8B3_9BACL|nr:extracellular solute-binding protein [Paenibacillus wynnii]KGE18785.1 hypothetical protein PWYN_04935 [Paenibacillus wynnii]
MKPINIRWISFMCCVLILIAGGLLTHELWQQNAPLRKVPSKENNKVVLTFAYNGGVSDQEMISLIDQYNRTNTDRVTIELQEIPKDEYSRILNMQMIAGTGPDILTVSSDWKKTYFLKNWLADISKELYSDGMPDYNDWAIEYGSFNKEIYSVPHAFNTSRLIYNKNLFRSAGIDPESPPTTLNELSNIAVKISNSQIGFQRYGFAWPLGDQEIGFKNSMEVPLTYSGLSVFDYAKGKYDLNSFGTWFEKMLELKNNGGLLPGEMSLKYNSALTQFAKGNVGMMFISSSDVYHLEHELDMQFDWGVAFPPALDSAHKGKHPLVLLPEPMIAVNNASPNKTQALNFWKYLESTVTLSDLYAKQVILPYSSTIRNQPLAVDIDQGSHFRLFYPNKHEAFYPPGPSVLNMKLNPNQSIFLNVKWNNRFEAYLEAVSGRIPIKNALSLETKRLNVLLQSEINAGHILIDSFISGKFESPFID